MLNNANEISIVEIGWKFVETQVSSGGEEKKSVDNFFLLFRFLCHCQILKFTQHIDRRKVSSTLRWGKIVNSALETFFYENWWKLRDEIFSISLWIDLNCLRDFLKLKRFFFFFLLLRKYMGEMKKEKNNGKFALLLTLKIRKCFNPKQQQLEKL